MQPIKIVLTIFTFAALASCKKAETGNSVSFVLSPELDIIEVTKSSVGDYTTLPTSSDFSISIKNDHSAELWSGLISEYDSNMKLAAGNYTVDAVYGTEGEEGFDKPYFTGSQSFAVEGAKNTNVTIPVRLGNSLVKIECSDEFKNYFQEYSFRISTGSNSIVDFTKEETRAAFIEAYKFTISGEMSSISGTKTTFSKEYSSGIEPATCYTIRFGLSNVGGVSVTITFNDSIQTVNLGDVELND